MLLLPDWQKLKYPTAITGKDRAARIFVNHWMEYKVVRLLGETVLYFL